jgi:hypothetical protein
MSSIFCWLAFIVALLGFLIWMYTRFFKTNFNLATSDPLTLRLRSPQDKTDVQLSRVLGVL